MCYLLCRQALILEVRTRRDVQYPDIPSLIFSAYANDGARFVQTVLHRHGKYRKFLVSKLVDGLFVKQTQIPFGQLKAGLRLEAVREDDKQDVIGPDFLELFQRKGNVAQRRICHVDVAVLVFLQHHEMLEATVVDRHDGRGVKILEVFDAGLETTARVTQRGRQALHVEQREATTLDNLVVFAETQQPFHDLALFKLAPEVAVQHGGHGGGTAGVVIRLAHDIL